MIDTQSKKPLWLAYVIPLIVLVLTALLYNLILETSNSSQSQSESSSNDFYVLVSLIEVRSKPLSGEYWDRIDGSAPDIFYQIHWRGHVVFESSVKLPTLSL